MLTLPFLWQPFNVDDHISLDSARNNLEHPFRLHFDEYHLLGRYQTEWRDTRPPGLHQYLALAMRVSSSESEPVMHLAYLVFPLAAALAFYSLARRFTRHPLAAAMLFAATPAFLTNAHMLMGDLAMTAAWLVAAALYVEGVDGDDGPRLAWAGLAATVSLFIGYQALLLIALLPLYALLKGKLTPRTAAPLALPLAAFAAYTAFNLWRYGSLPRFSHAGGLGLSGSHLWDRLQGALLKTGGATVFPLFIITAYAVRKKQRLLVAAAAVIAAAAALIQVAANGFPALPGMLFAVFMAASLTVLLPLAGDLAAAARRRFQGDGDGDGAFLVLWLLSVLALDIVLLPHATVKYYLPLLAPLVLLTVRELEAARPSPGRWRALAATGIALTLAAGLLVSAADYRFGLSYRDFARSVPGRYPDAGRVWFVGEWGLRWYMEQEGYRYLATDETGPEEGDIIVIPYLMGWPLSPGVTGRMELTDVVEDDWALPLRVMDFQSEAGYYGSHWGALPWSFSNSPVETFRVYRTGPRTE